MVTLFAKVHGQWRPICGKAEVEHVSTNERGVVSIILTTKVKIRLSHDALMTILDKATQSVRVEEKSNA